MDPESKNKGATFLKWGMLARSQTAPIKDVRAGNFGKTDLELVMAGRRFIVSISPKNPEYAALIAAFGPPDKWIGCQIMVADSNVVKTVEIAPVADAKGKPVGAPTPAK